MFQRLTIISLCMILLFQAGGLLCFYLIKMKVQEVVQQELLAENQNVKTQTFSHHDFNLMRINAHEVLINGKMYDFSTLEKTKDHITVNLISDQEEDHILLAIGHFFGKGQHEKPSNDFPKQIIQWFQTPYISAASWEWGIPTFLDTSTNLFKCNFLSTSLQEIIPEPPEA